MRCFADLLPGKGGKKTKIGEEYEILRQNQFVLLRFIV